MRPPTQSLRSWLLAALFLGCSSSGPAPAETPKPLVTVAQAPDAGETPASEAAASSESPDASAGLDLRNDTDAVGWVKYTETSAGLQIELDGGAQFVVSALALRVGPDWGVKVKISARASKRPQKLLNPKQGPLEFKGSIERGKHTNRFGEQRDGNGVIVLEQKPLEFTRDWPGNSREKALKPGDKLQLELALWGVSTAMSKDPIPWPYFAVVRMTVDKGKADVVVLKPEAYRQ